MAKHSGGSRISRPISMGAGMGGLAGGGRNSIGHWLDATPKAIRAAESSIKDNKFETAFIFSEFGVLLNTIKGEAHEVRIPDAISLKDKIVTHNHPGGLSLTQQDIYSAAKDNVSEIRAVAGSGRVYSMRRKGNNWPSNEEIKEAFKQAERTVKMRTREYTSRAYSGSDKELVYRVKQMRAMSVHLTMKEAASLLKLDYSYKKIY